MHKTSNSADSMLFSNQFGYIEGCQYDAEHDESLVWTDTYLVQVSGQGKILDSISLPYNDRVISASRDSRVWSILIQSDSTLSLISLPRAAKVNIDLQQVNIHPQSVCWSTCRKYIAIGDSKSPSIGIWGMSTGACYWCSRVELNLEGEIINPPSLFVKGWSLDSQTIVTTVDHLMRSIIVFWDAHSGTVRLVIE